MKRSNNTPPISLLAPARDVEVGKAAVQAGADAVYIGAPEFGARQAAGNSVEDIAELVRYAHQYGVEVLVTLNTLLHEDEYSRACALARELYKIGVDALIIQDLNLLNYDLPPIRLHASTQCDNRTSEQVLQLQQMGFHRVVLARELSIQEIQNIKHEVLIHNSKFKIELEAFVHGALCVSYSGKCYLSEVLMNRSANRGCCAQLCRQRYDLLDKNGNEIIDNDGQTIHQRYLLSLQDMDRSMYLAEMIEAGITTFKIEGRLKDREYVTNIVAYYRQLLDQLIESNPLLQSASKPSVYEYDFTPNPTKTFHRGATDYFLHNRTRSMANWETPKSTGERIGKVVAVRGKAIRVQLEHNITLHNGDGLCYGDKGFAINRVDGDWIYANQFIDIAPNTLLYRNLDTTFTRSLHATRRLPIAIRFETTEIGYRLTIDNHSAEFIYGKQPANNTQRTLQTIRQQLSKLGDTYFIAQNVTILAHGKICETDFPYFIPTSLLNQWRRQLTQKHHSEYSKNTDNNTQKNISIPHVKYELNNQALMTCKYCILNELGHCRKLNPINNEPRYLRLQNGIQLILEFDCQKCEMRIYKNSIHNS